MTDFFDPGGGDEQVLAKLQEIVREAGLQPYFDSVADESISPSSTTIHILNRTGRLLDELRELDESLEDAGEWKGITFMADPELPLECREPAASSAVFRKEARFPAQTFMDRQGGRERIQAITHAQKLILKLRHAVRHQV